MEPGETNELNLDYWYIFAEGQATVDGVPVTIGEEFGWKPFSDTREGFITAQTRCRLVKITTNRALELIRQTPQLNYSVRKRRVEEGDPAVDWLLGEVDIYQPVSK